MNEWKNLSTASAISILAIDRDGLKIGLIFVCVPAQHTASIMPTFPEKSRSESAKRWKEEKRL